MIRAFCGALARDRRGAAIVEFALLAPAFFAFIFLVIEGGRMIWTQQVLQETAFASARCLGVDSPSCESIAETKEFAVDRAGGSGVQIELASVDANNVNVTCNERSDMARIVISSPYSPIVGSLLPNARNALTVSACFPNVPSA